MRPVDQRQVALNRCARAPGRQQAALVHADRRGRLRAIQRAAAVGHQQIPLLAPKRQALEAHLVVDLLRRKAVLGLKPHALAPLAARQLQVQPVQVMRHHRPVACKPGRDAQRVFPRLFEAVVRHQRGTGRVRRLVHRAGVQQQAILGFLHADAPAQQLRAVRPAEKQQIPAGGMQTRFSPNHVERGHTRAHGDLAPPSVRKDKLLENVHFVLPISHNRRSAGPVGGADSHLLPPKPHESVGHRLEPPDSSWSRSPGCTPQGLWVGSIDEFGNHRLEFPNSAFTNPSACFAGTSPFMGGRLSLHPLCFRSAEPSRLSLHALAAADATRICRP